MLANEVGNTVCASSEWEGVQSMQIFTFVYYYYYISPVYVLYFPIKIGVK
jgi:hypothetical protein